jgi:ribosomal protein S18 acetylase RimI-like enzyme
MTISNSTIDDIDEIFRLYRIATAYQKTKEAVAWPEFDRKLVEKEISENHQWKLHERDTIACVWATTFNDPQIWEERDADPSVYIHRIATNPEFRGQNLVGRIVSWARDFAVANNRKFIRLDTVGENQGLIKYYSSCGFQFLGLQKLMNTNGLPAHYDNASVSLFELAL